MDWTALTLIIVIAVACAIPLVKWQGRLLQVRMGTQGGTTYPAAADSGGSVEDYAPVETWRAPEPESERGVLPRRSILRALSRNPSCAWLEEIALGDRHTVVAGGTGSGKTTLQYTLLCAALERGQALVVSTLGRPQKDFGLAREHIHGIGDKPEVALRALRAIADERNRRAELEAQDVDGFDYPPIFVFIDEYPDLMQDEAAGKEVAAIVKRIARTGRQLGIFLRLTAQDTLVETLGFPKTVLDANFYRVGKGKEAKRMSKGVAVGNSEKATTVERADGSLEPVDTALLMHVPQRFTPDESRLWRLPVASSAALLDDDEDDATPIPAAKREPAVYTVDDVRVAGWIAADPEISTREIARRLFPKNSNGSGPAFEKAKAIRARVSRVTSEALPEGVTSDM